MHRDRGRTGGFTIIELLTVIAILVILMGLLVSALAGARKTSQKARELNDLRQVGLAWQVYSNTNGDTALPGYIDAEVQTDWNVEYDYPSGEVIPQTFAATWTFRLLPLLDYSHDIVHGYAVETDSDPLGWANNAAEALDLSQHPAFGYNAMHVGGWWEMADMGGQQIPRYRYYDARADLNGDGTIEPTERSNVVSRSVSTIRRATQLVVFCSSAQMEPGTTYDKVKRDIEGSHWVSPPWLAEQQQWMVFDPNLSDAYLTVVGDSPAPIGRHNGNAAVLYADLHNSSVLPGALVDQRAFIDVADRIDWKCQ